MSRFIFIFAAFLILPPQAGAHILCGDRNSVLRLFQHRYGDWKVTTSFRQWNTTVEILNSSRTHTWAVMGKNFRGQTCITVRQSDLPAPPQLMPMS